jgi:hypothetical protein
VAKAKPKPKAIFEFVDDRGVTRRVGTLQEVPKKYVRKMLVIGVEENAASTAAPALPSAGAAMPAIAPWSWALPAVFILLLARSKNFVFRALGATGLLIWLFYYGYGWFMASDYSHTYEKPAPPALSERGESKDGSKDPSPAALQAAEKLEDAMLKRRLSEQAPSRNPSQ